MGEIKIIEQKTACEFCGEEEYIGAEVVYEKDIFWACLPCNEKVENLKNKEIEKSTPAWDKARAKTVKEINSKLK